MSESVVSDIKGIVEEEIDSYFKSLPIDIRIKQGYGGDGTESIKVEALSKGNLAEQVKTIRTNIQDKYPDAQVSVSLSRPSPIRIRRPRNE